MRSYKCRVFFYDGNDYSTGEMLSGAEAYFNNYIDWHETDGLAPTDECSIMMQYTGLVDKNGVEICEGDIVKGYYENFLVSFNNNNHGRVMGWNLLDKDGDAATYYYGESPDGYNEVIGNIYQNPELLKQKK